MKSLLGLPFLALVSLSLQAYDYSGNVALELQVFPQSASAQNQLDENLTLSFKPKFTHGWNSGNDALNVELFFRVDDKDEERQHADIREFKWLHVAGNHEWRVGIDSVFWGVTESQHLVDVINQIDQVEGIDGEDKLGQPMIHYTTIQDWGVFHVFVLPGFREASFHSEQGRLRLPFVVDTGQTAYESSDEDQHVDFALRYTRSVGDTEFGLSWFDGTNREPVINNVSAINTPPVFAPTYQQMTQFGLDLQSFLGDWTWKAEMIRRESNSTTFTAVTAGFEYTIYGILDSAIDLGTLVEYSWDDKPDYTSVFNNDVFGGLRFAFNDVQSSEILAGLIVDIDNQSQSMRVEASRRLGDSWKLTGELQIFTVDDEYDPLNTFARDDYLQLELARYF